MIDDLYKAEILEISDYSISLKCDSVVDIDGVEVSDLQTHICLTPKFPGIYKEQEYINTVIILEAESQIISNDVVIMQFKEKINKETVEKNKEYTFLFVYKKINNN